MRLVGLEYAGHDTAILMAAAAAGSGTAMAAIWYAAKSLGSAGAKAVGDAAISGFLTGQISVLTSVASAVASIFVTQAIRNQIPGTAMGYLPNNIFELVPLAIGVTAGLSVQTSKASYSSLSSLGSILGTGSVAFPIFMYSITNMNYLTNDEPTERMVTAAGAAIDSTFAVMGCSIAKICGLSPLASYLSGMGSALIGLRWLKVI